MNWKKKNTNKKKVLIHKMKRYGITKTSEINVTLQTQKNSRPFSKFSFV